MIGSIFSGYRCKPRLFIDEPIEKQIININNKTLVYLQKAMSAVARYGTGRLVGAIKNITVFAKTGTAQTTTYKNAIKKNNEHGWFTCYVTRKKENPLVMVILAENAGSSRIATRIAHNFLTKYAQI
jgi:cell division protein FtsI/penicillin-binding protein 2